MFPNVEARHLYAVIILAEELNFTRAAHRLHITQSALSKQITEIEEQNRFHLFGRDKGRVVELTDAGRIFVEEARAALLHTERAIHLARVAHEGAECILMVGHSPYVEQSWISTILALRLPLFPKLRIRLVSGFPIELVRSVLAGELDLALVTAPPKDSQITAVPFARAPLYAILPESHPSARKEWLTLQDIAKDEWILFDRRVHPLVHDAALEVARLRAITPKYVHGIITPQQAFHLVYERIGVAILTKPTALGCQVDGVVVRPLSDESLWFDTCLIMGCNDNSRITNEFARSFLRRYAPQHAVPEQMELAPPA